MLCSVCVESGVISATGLALGGKQTVRLLGEPKMQMQVMQGYLKPPVNFQRRNMANLITVYYSIGWKESYAVTFKPSLIVGISLPLLSVSSSVKWAEAFLRAVLVTRVLAAGSQCG